jgi:hypothetical protein
MIVHITIAGGKTTAYHIMCFFLDSPASAGMFLNVCFSFPNDHQ